MGKIQVSVVIVNYNTTALTQACIQSVINYTTCTFEIIVVDNASLDQSIASLPNLFTNVQLILNPQNSGFAAANNLGASHARGTYLFFLNPDTLLTSDAIGTFLHFMNVPSKEKIAGCGASLIDLNGARQVSYGNFPSLFELFSALGPWIFYKEYYLKKISIAVKVEQKLPYAVDYVSGAALFLKKTIFDQVNCFDTDFFLYFEETELAFRMAKQGYHLYILPEVKIVHLERQSPHPNGLASKNKIFEKSRLLFFSKCYSNGSLFLARGLCRLQQLKQCFRLKLSSK